MPSERSADTAWLRRLALVQCVLGALFCLSLRFRDVGWLADLAEPVAIAAFTIGACAALLWAPLSRRGDAKRALSLLIQSGAQDLAGAAPLAEPDLRAAAAMLGVNEIALLVPERGSRSHVVWAELKALRRGTYKTYRVPLGGSGEDEALGFVVPPGLHLPRPYVVKPLMGQSGELARIVVGVAAAPDEGAPTAGPAESLLALLGAWWSMRLDNRRLAADAEQRLLDIVESLITSVEAKDPYTSGHSKRVCRYSELIAQSMGITGRELEEIAVGAALHDVGKLGIPEHVLRKPSKLDDAEWEQIKSHPKVGARIIDSFNQSYQVLYAIQHHHEHWNGNGYPGRLAGEAIPLPARIVGVADALDAMTSARSYQRNRTVADAVEELRRSAGRQFDPAIVEAVLRIPIAALEAIAPAPPVPVPDPAPLISLPTPVAFPA
ncbi:MAG: HD-GYP domain-containing protein [Chloroflexota bacterium]